jgi:hypothetical protein
MFEWPGGFDSGYFVRVNRIITNITGVAEYIIIIAVRG